MAQISPHRYFKKRLHRIRRLAKAVSAAPRKAQVHQLRIELKRWRAHLRLLEAVDPAFPYPEMYAPFKKLFAQAGQLRFWQLQRSFLQHAECVSPAFDRGYRRYLRARYRTARTGLQTAAAGRLPHWRDLKHELHQSAALCTPAAVQVYFEGLRKNMETLERSPSRQHSTELHELRKILKEYANNRRLALRHFNLGPGPVAPTPPNFDILLGQWHDADAACAQLALDMQEQEWTPEALAGGEKLLKEWREKELYLWEEVVQKLETKSAGPI